MAGCAVERLAEIRRRRKIMNGDQAERSKTVRFAAAGDKANDETASTELEFHDDLHLFIYRPHGVIDEAAVKKVVFVLEDLEAKLQEPFNRFSDTLGPMKLNLISNTSFKFSLLGAFPTRGIHR